MSSGRHSHSRQSSSTIPNKRAALYLRSSKDRANVSIDAQRRELKALALSKNLPIVAEFADVVLSGADETRPGFQSLLREIQSRQCRFTHVALITMEEAETILKRLESRPSKRATRATYLLTGLLFTPEGNPWYGNANKGGLYYRSDKRNVLASRVDQAVMTSVVADLQCDLFFKEATESCKRAQAPSTRAQEYLNAERELRAVTDHIDKLTRLLTQTDKPEPLLRRLKRWSGNGKSWPSILRSSRSRRNARSNSPPPPKLTSGERCKRSPAISRTSRTRVRTS